MHPVEQNVYVARPDPNELKATAEVVTFTPLNIESVATSIQVWAPPIRLYTIALLKLWGPAFINNQTSRNPSLAVWQKVRLVSPSLHFEAG